MRRSWEYSAYQITKYNPIYRDEKNVYLKDEWVDVGDIGRTFDGEVFTLQEYLEVEQKYIEAIQIVMQLSGCDKLYVRHLDKHEDISYFDDEVNKELFSYYKTLKNKLEVSSETLPYIMKIILRCLSWCELVNTKKKLYVRLGYDYYMSVNTKVPLKQVKEEVEKLGLFVEG